MLRPSSTSCDQLSQEEMWSQQPASPKEEGTANNLFDGIFMLTIVCLLYSPRRNPNKHCSYLVPFSFANYYVN